jgi:transcriptional regulator with XRE-family HTH domain
MNKFLRQAMRDRGWTIPQLADACDASLGLVQRWVSENPRYQVTPSPASCEKIAAALSLDPDTMLELAGHRHRRAPLEDDPIEQAIRQGTVQMHDVLADIPRPYWATIIKATFDRAIDGARDMAALVSDYQSADRSVRSPADAANRRRGGRPNRHASGGAPEITAHYLSPSLVLATP